MVHRILEFFGSVEPQSHEGDVQGSSKRQCAWHGAEHIGDNDAFSKWKCAQVQGSIAHFHEALIDVDS